MNGKDVSSWLLIEDSADSEGDSGFFTLYPCNIVANIGHNEDDAESCTCDTAGVCGLFEDGEDHEDEKGCGEFCGDEDEGCDSEWSSSTVWLSESDAALEIECSSPLVVEDEGETRIVKVNVNDVEDKIFWETCMAVGYP
ncbi:hypothetical protein E2542_SST00764 [Spatholobus suberectus]|nr:hypothetical protein E2542_SST00764 [Spatholobus suberectus]